MKLSFLSLAALAASSVVARADSLTLVPLATIDVSGVPLTSIGDLAFDSGNRLWVADGANGGFVYELNGNTGALLNTFDPAVVPGLTGGPDALAVIRGSNARICMFSPFGSSTAAGAMSLTGAFIASFTSSQSATGADFSSSGNLYVASGTSAGSQPILRQLSSTNGFSLTAVPIAGLAERIVDIAFDPASGGLYCLTEGGLLVEVDLVTGAQLSTTSIGSLLPVPMSIAGGIAFDQEGDRFFVGVGTGTSADTIHVFQRTFFTTDCEGSQSAVACPCGNSGLPGHGCNNSLANGGARLVLNAFPSVSTDETVLRATNLPSGAPVLFFQGTASAGANPTVFGDGLRCVSGTVIRLGTHAATGSGTAIYPESGDADISIRGLIPATGGVRSYQAWYRNAADFCSAATFNLSNGITVSWGA